jgi:ComF family protein
MADVRWRRLGKAGSLESMPWPVNFAARTLVDGCVRLLWPARCLVCGDPGARGRDLCAACADALPWNHSACATCALPLPGAPAEHDALAEQRCGACLRRPPPLAATRAAFVYGFPVDRLLPRLKFHQGLAAGRLMSQLAAEAFATAPRPDAVVPIPLHRARLRARGYDQALELARPLARALALPLRDDLLRRRKATAQQSRLDATARRRNLRRAFEVIPREAMPAHVVLFDDVMTTGATLHAAATALRRAGIGRVDAWVCARVP